MSTVTPLAAVLEEHVGRAMAGALPAGADGADPLIRPSDHADFQANGMLPLAKRLRANPRELAGNVAGALAADPLIASCEASGPGFLNISLAGAAIWQQLGRPAR